MCGRFNLDERLEQLQRHYEIHEINYDYQPSYNIAPTDPITTVTVNDQQGKFFQQINWGIPVKIEKLNNLLINIRDDKIDSNGFYNKMFESYRCLIPASGFFEWNHTGSSKKIPYLIKSETPIVSFAGLFYKIQEVFYTAIITTTPNSVVATLHDRMPVMLTKEEENIWLDSNSSRIELFDLLDPFPSDLTQYYEVSSRVNSVKNNSPDLIKPKKPSSSLSDFF